MTEPATSAIAKLEQMRAALAAIKGDLIDAANDDAWPAVQPWLRHSEPRVRGNRVPMFRIPLGPPTRPMRTVSLSVD
jgi:hypothetical protein